MKNLYFFFTGILVCCTLANTGCSKDEALSDDIRLLKTNMKGWELYSLPLKTYDEVVSPLISDLESLKDSLDMFRENESIYWISREWLENIWMTGYGDLSLPDAAAIKEVKDYCGKKGLIFTVIE